MVGTLVGSRARARASLSHRARRGWGLRALAERLGDGLGGCAYAELGFKVREPLADGVKAEGQLRSDVRLVLHRCGRLQHLGLAWGQPEAVERVRAEAGDLLLEQQRVRIAGQKVDGEAPAVAHADERRARRQRQPLGDRTR